jgi:hypothetical protein
MRSTKKFVSRGHTNPTKLGPRLRRRFRPGFGWQHERLAALSSLLLLSSPATAQNQDGAAGFRRVAPFRILCDFLKVTITRGPSLFSQAFVRRLPNLGSVRTKPTPFYTQAIILGSAWLALVGRSKQLVVPAGATQTRQQISYAPVALNLFAIAGRERVSSRLAVP